MIVCIRKINYLRRSSFILRNPIGADKKPAKINRGSLKLLSIYHLPVTNRTHSIRDMSRPSWGKNARPSITFHSRVAPSRRCKLPQSM